MWARLSRHQKLILGGSTTATVLAYLHYQHNNGFKTRSNIVYAEQAASVEKPTTWHAPTRKQELSKLKSNKEFDLLIVGGGATGTGVALDAASRGLDVALVERDDFASGNVCLRKSTRFLSYLKKKYNN